MLHRLSPYNLHHGLGAVKRILGIFGENQQLGLVAAVFPAAFKAGSTPDLKLAAQIRAVLVVLASTIRL